MRIRHLGLAFGLLSPATLAQADPTVIRVPTGTCAAAAFPGPSGSGTGSNSGRYVAGTSKTEQVTDLY